MKTGYKSILEGFIRYIGEEKLEIIKDRYQYKVFVPNHMLIRDNFSRDSIYGFGDDVENACEECFNKLVGKTIISITGDEFNFDMFLERYKKQQKEKIKKYPSLKEYKEIIKLSTPRKSQIKAEGMIKEIIKGHELIIFPYPFNNYYYLYDINYPKDMQIESSDYLEIWIHDLEPEKGRENKKYLISKCNIVLSFN